MRDAELMILTAIAVLTAVVILGFQAVLERCRPRIIYVHAGGKDAKADDREQTPAA